jgi:CRP/FNR family cyclic AMP-dependent transcriptional regulator
VDSHRAPTRLVRPPDLPHSLPEGDVAALAGRLRRRVYRAGEPIIGPETPAERIYLVLAGRVRLFHRGPDGREVTVAVVGRGRIFGVSALLGQEQDGPLAEAAVDTLVCAAEAPAFLQLVAEHPSLMLRLAAQLGQRLIEVEQQLDHLASSDTRTRLVRALCQLAGQDGDQLPAGERRIRTRPTHAEWARQIGASRETVTRLLGRLEDEGHIRRDRRHIVVRNPTGLANEAGLDLGTS